jgi:membrane protease YdiL (CAAX protease family)
MKVQPRPLVGVLVLVAYLAVFYGVWVLTGIDYERVGDSADTLLKWYVAPLAAGAVVLVVAASVLGWWRAALFEVRTAPRWTLVTPTIMLVLAVAALLVKDYSDTTGTMVLYLVLGSIGVGFCEELATRGLLLTGLRGTLTERRAWLWSTLLFGLLHLPNWVFGAGPGAIAQVGMAFLAGTTLYLLRRGAGTLVAAMLLHAVWDFSSFIGDGGAFLGVLNVPVGIASVVIALVLVRRDRQEPTLAPYAVAPVAA